jgi:predicted nucleotidyltransferase
MDQVPDQIIDSIKKLIEALEQDDIKIKRAILFGSYAKGTFNELSDIDLALISDSFSGNRFLDKERIRKHILSVNTDISPMPYRPEDFNDDDYMAIEIQREGITIN